MVAVAQSDSTYTAISKMVRRLTASASESALSTADLDEIINHVYNNDFPYAIKIDQTRSVYKFFTIPNVDRYPTDVNNNQGYRSPIYVEGVQGNFFKDRQQFFNLYPRYPTQMQISPETESGTITGIAQPTNPTEITSMGHNLTTGATITISDVLGMTQLNGNTYTITVIDANTFSLNGIDNTAFGSYTSGGTWISTSPTFSFNLFGYANNPFPQPNFGILSTSVVIGGIDVNGNPIRVTDDGGAVVNGFGVGNNTTTGQLIYVNTNTVGNNIYLDTANGQQNAIPALSPLPQPAPKFVPPISTSSPAIGTVNYITSQFNFTLPVAPAPGTMLNIWCNQYVAGRPYSILFWNNEITVRPVPDNVYSIEIETFLTPTQFLQTTDNPVLKQWSYYIAYIAAMEILRQRQDVDGVENLREGMMRQEALVLERQSVEEIFQPTYQLFNSTTSAGGYSVGLGWGGF